MTCQKFVQLLAGFVPNVDVPGSHGQHGFFIDQDQEMQVVNAVLDGGHHKLLGDGEQGDTPIHSSCINTVCTLGPHQ